MTRFARAKGSKAANKKVPEEATPWSELKEQITQNSTKEKEHKKEEPEEHEQKNWKLVLGNEKKVKENLNSAWCDFDESEDTTNNTTQEKRKSKKAKNMTTFEEENSVKGKKNKKRQLISEVEESDEKPSKKKKKRHIEIEDQGSDVDNTPKSKKSKIKFSQDLSKEVCTDETTEVKDDIKSQDDRTIEENSFNNKNQARKKFKGSNNWSITGKEHKMLKYKSNPHQRNKRDQGNLTLDVNGEQIELVRFDGFHIRKDDAERIRKLEKDLIKRGVPREEIRTVVKKERRNAEKSLARLKKNVCFNCRSRGHALSSCPKLGDGLVYGQSSGICYKCGSTEHTHFECRVTSGQVYKFATCFICKEQGHISKQCPDNPRGLYPNGGACKLCGDVTHLKRDCPTQAKKTDGTVVTAGQLNKNVDILDDNEIQTIKINDGKSTKKVNKIVKFT